MAYIQDQIRQVREAKGLTQSDLGRGIGQPQSSISRIERGGDIRLSTLLELARVLELEPMLVPKHLIPAVQALVGHTVEQENSDSVNAPLVGGVPEDAENDAK
jgi:transcriptional regulator with XRE-family HTH domain